MKAGEELIYLYDGDDVPDGYTLVQADKVFSHWETEDERDYHPMQTPAQWKVYKNRYLYKLNK